MNQRKQGWREGRENSMYPFHNPDMESPGETLKEYHTRARDKGCF